MAEQATPRANRAHLRDVAAEYEKHFAQLAAKEGTEVMLAETLIYQSSNGDRWLLDARHRQVRHHPNRASGGRMTCYKIGEFLAEGTTPQQEALRLLLAEMSCVPPVAN